MSLTFGYKSDVGRKRSANQDSYVIVRGETLNGELDALFVIADGMGGRQGGEVASEIVVRTLPEYVTSHLEQRNGDKSPVDAAQLLEEGIALAHSKVRQRQTQQLELSGMGTTCVACILDANILTVANVGDSRAYLLRDGTLTQITEDHSEVWQEVVAGRMTREEAQKSRFRNVITRAVGSAGNALPDIDMVELKEGDSVLLCSDGLSSEVEDEEIERLLAGEADAQRACEKLVDAALFNGGKDNVTVVVLRYGAFVPHIHLKKEKMIVQESVDPLEGWRESLQRTSASYTNETPNPEILPESTPRPARPGASPLLLGLLFVLAVLAGGEGYALYQLNRTYQALLRKPPVVIQPPMKPTDKDLNYSEPIVFCPKTVRETPLAAADEDSILAVSKVGNLMRIAQTGRIMALPDTMKLPAPATASKAPPEPLMVTDVSGNRYQINPGEKFIGKFDPEGKPVLAAIGKGKLTHPTALTVDSAGNIYVIDEGHIKKISAYLNQKPGPGVPPSHP